MSSVTRPKAVFFDIGNTVISGDPRRSVRAFLDEHGATADWSRARDAARAAFEYYEANHLSCTTFEAGLEVWRGFDRLLLAGLGVENHEWLADRLVERWEDPSVWPLRDGALDTIRALRAAGVTVGAVSNWDAGLERVLGVAGLGDAFDFVIASAGVGFAKPDRRIFERALERAAVSAGDAVHVGDSPVTDVAGARAAGIRPVLVSPVAVDGVDVIRELPELLGVVGVEAR